MSLSVRHKFDPSSCPEKKDLLFEKFEIRENYCRKTCRYNQFVLQILEDEETPEVLKEILNQYRHRYPVLTILTQRESFFTFEIKFEGVVELTEYYKKKYGISIKPILLEDLFDDIESSLELKEEPQAYIVHVKFRGGTETETHVTPILCQKTRYGIKLVSLDTSGPQADMRDPFRSLSNLCKLKKVSCFQLKEARKTYEKASATDAILVLRNALLDIRKRRERGESCELMSLVSKCNGQTRLNKSYVSVPPQWVYTSQLAPEAFMKKDGIQESVPRDLYSNDETKKTNPKNLSRIREPYSREPYSREVGVDFEIYLRKDHLRMIQEFWELGNDDVVRVEKLRQIVLSSCLEMKEHEGTPRDFLLHELSFRYRTSRRENTYFRRKNYAFARYLNNLNQPTSRQQPEVLPPAQEQTTTLKRTPKRSLSFLSRSMIFSTALGVASLVADRFFTGENFNQTMIALGLREEQEPSTFSNCYGYC